MSCLFSAALAVCALRRQLRPRTLTVYTYESFTAEWGPGPQVEKAFEAECGCDVEFVSVADGVALLNRVKLEGPATKADIVLGLDTNLTAEAKATGLFAPHGVDQSALDRSRRLERRHLRALRLRLFRRRLRHRESLEPRRRASKELVEGDPEQKIVIEDPRTSTPGPRPAAVGEGGLRRQGGRGLGEAQAARADRDAGLERGLRPVHQGRGADGAVLHDLARLPHDRRGHRALPGGRLRGGPLPADRGGRHDGEGRQEPAGAEVPGLHDQPGFQDAIPETNWMFPAAKTGKPLNPAFDTAGEAGKDADLQPRKRSRTTARPGSTNGWRR